MKRSEMIKKMVHDTFQQLQGENINTPEFPYKVAELMLEVCEKEGMVPPMLPIPEYAFQADHAWEPE